MRKINLEEAINTLVVNGGFKKKDLLKMGLYKFIDKVDSYIGKVKNIEIKEIKK